MTFTKEHIIEELKASTQNASGMFEIGEETICALVSLLTAPPAPASVSDRSMFEKWWESEHGSPFDSWDSLRTNDGYCDEGIDVQFEAWNACRAAMLQGAEQQNQQQNIPQNIPVNTPCKEAPEHIWLQTAGVWPENGELSELTWCRNNQHEDDTLYVRADVVTGNSKVIPDDWVMVPVEPTAEMQSAAAGAIRFDTTPINKLWTGNAVYRAMLAAAPQQEVKP